MRKVLLLLFVTGIYCLSVAQSSTPKLAIDHVFIWTEKDAPEVKLFQEKGFTISPHVMVHTGFGTGGRYINFYNVYVEFLYLDDKATIDPKVTYFPAGRRNKMREEDKSPFGLGLYMSPYDTTRFPFAVEAVHAPWMQPNTNLYIAGSGRSHEQEPILFIVPPYMEMPKLNTLGDLEKLVSDSVAKERVTQSLTHANGTKKLTDVKVISTAEELSPTMKALEKIDNLSIVKGKEHLLEMTFDEHRQKKTLDFRPKLPVIVKY